jgi:hypothetical protein
VRRKKEKTLGAATKPKHEVIQQLAEYIAEHTGKLAKQRDTYLVLAESGLEAQLRSQKLAFVDLNRDVLIKVATRANYTGLDHLWLPRTVLASDFVVSMPKMKTHHWAGVTLSMKNMFGIVPGTKYGWPKNILHWKGSIAASSTSAPRRRFTLSSRMGRSPWRAMHRCTELIGTSARWCSPTIQLQRTSCVRN